MLYYCFCFYLPAGVVAISTVVGAVTSTGTASKVVALDDIFAALFPSGEAYQRVGGAPYTNGAKAHKTREVLVRTVHANHRFELAHEFQFFLQFELPGDTRGARKDGGPLA